MKKTKMMLAGLFGAAMLFTSCSSDDSSSSSSSSLVGKWNFDTVQYSAAGQSAPEEPYEDNEPGCAKDYLEFKEDGTLIEGDYWSSECTLETSTGTYTKSGNKVTITFDGESSTATIMSVNDSQLKVKTTETWEGVTVTTIIKFKKA